MGKDSAINRDLNSRIGVLDRGTDGEIPIETAQGGAHNDKHSAGVLCAHAADTLDQLADVKAKAQGLKHFHCDALVGEKRCKIRQIQRRKGGGSDRVELAISAHRVAVCNVTGRTRRIDDHNLLETHGLSPSFVRSWPRRG